ncbi:hypothetical protein FPOAC2_04889 [Fusarium poae]
MTAYRRVGFEFYQIVRVSCTNASIARASVFSRTSCPRAMGMFMQNQDAISEPRNRNPMESQKSKGVLFFFTSLLKHVKHRAHAPSRPFRGPSSTNQQTQPPQSPPYSSSNQIPLWSQLTL